MKASLFFVADFFFFPGALKGGKFFSLHLAICFSYLCLLSSFRNLGIGGLLLDTAINEAMEKGFKSIEVAVFADNKNMLSLVIKNYFKPVKIEYRKRHDGEDIIYFKKYLK